MISPRIILLREEQENMTSSWLSANAMRQIQIEKKLLKTMKQVPRNIASKKLVRRSFAYLYKTQCVTFVLTKTTNYSIVHMNEGVTPLN